MDRTFRLFLLVCMSVWLSQLGQSQVTFNLVPTKTNPVLNDTLSVSVRVNGFVDVGDFQQIFLWDPAVLELQQTITTNFQCSPLLDDFALPPNGCRASNFNFDCTPVSRLYVAWFNANNGQTLPNGSQLFRLRFKYISTTGAGASVGMSPTNIPFCSNPAGTANIALNNFAGQNIPWTFTPAVIGSPSCANFTYSTSLVGDPSRIQKDSTVCFNIDVCKFTEIQSQQFSISWNPAKFDFVSASVNPLDAVAPRTTLQQLQTSLGRLGFLWTAEDPPFHHTLPGTSSIYRVCLKVKIAGPSLDTIRFVNNPLDIDVSNRNGTSITPILSNVSYNILATAGSPPLDFTFVSTSACNGQSNGSIDITPTGGTPPYTFDWADVAGTNNPKDRSGLAARSYSLTVSDNSSPVKTVTKSITVASNPQIRVSQNVISDVSCFGGANGAIDINVSGGTPGYTYLWSAPGNETTQDIAGKGAGSYGITVTDARGCTSATIFSIGTPDQLVVSAGAVSNTPVGACTGSVSFNVTGGTPTYTAYNWTRNGTAFTAVPGPNSASNLCSGTYALEVVDAEGCKATAQSIVTETACNVSINEIEIENVVCFQQATGCIRAKLSVNPIPSTAKFRWYVQGSNVFVNETTVPELCGFSAGLYYFEYIDGGCIVRSPGIRITETQEIVITQPTITAESCDNTNGSIRLNVTGGTPGYVFEWKNAAGDIVGANKDLIGVKAGNYVLQIRDTKSCVKSASFTIETEPGPIALVLLSATAPSCANTATGSITVRVDCGRAPFEVTVGTQVVTSSDRNIVISGLGSGNLVVSVKDANTQTTTLNANVPVTLPLDITAAITNASDFGVANGAISVTVAGGTPIYTYEWNPSQGNLANITGLLAGNYRLTVTDSKGCKKDTLFMVTAGVLTLDSVNIKSPACATGSLDGSIRLRVKGGRPPYDYTWFPAANNVNELNSLAPGTYSYTVTDAAGAQISNTIVLASLSNLSATLAIQSNYNGFNVSGFFNSDGVAEVTAVNGFGTVNYNWVGSASNTNKATDLKRGPFSVVAEDAIGCKVILNGNMTSPLAIFARASVSNFKGFGVTCSNTCNGFVVIDSTTEVGGVKPFTYTLTELASGSTFTGRENRNLCAGTYRLVIKDKNNTTTIDTFRLRSPNPIIVNITTSEDDGSFNGSALANASGGIGVYNYAWSNGLRGQVIGSLRGGEIAMVTVTDENGCTVVDQKRIPRKGVQCLDVTTVLTPDGDAQNEVLYINCAEQYQSVDIQVFNRYSQMVFEQKGYNNLWAGTTDRGRELPDGPYFYVLKVKETSGAISVVKGAFQILRGN
jgi:gliding motility-associated-like protein